VSPPPPSDFSSSTFTSFVLHVPDFFFRNCSNLSFAELIFPMIDHGLLACPFPSHGEFASLVSSLIRNSRTFHPDPDILFLVFLAIMFLFFQTAPFCQVSFSIIRINSFFWLPPCELSRSGLIEGKLRTASVSLSRHQTFVSLNHPFPLLLLFFFFPYLTSRYASSWQSQCPLIDRLP